mmetsp:Transcript_32643/g.39515  ORF Transcript_32643/g.39515 Transcript_32643/m.39515 type:complete len:225 (+) Transcript_32643:169-843(+)|eukprot:CAMPEP_0197862722 /NCGR_PEP_ID=MMETSP1438-20131217/39697_1 /TAXON_ID=1461541 /ORGANISM="Pterosperma sp., Strain CCMP1384" /LENGTH=224 /DNA_ID=CAMNT_0043480379 /DNA_START=169 /DNA_END=843 /DNA_ORIENTATION=-
MFARSGIFSECPPEEDHPVAGSRPATPSHCPRAALNLPCQWCRVLLTSSQGRKGSQTLKPIERGENGKPIKKNTYDDILKKHSIEPRAKGDDDRDLSELAERDLNVDDRPSRLSKYDQLLKRHGISDSEPSTSAGAGGNSEVLTVSHNDSDSEGDEEDTTEKGEQLGEAWKKEVKIMQDLSKGLADNSDDDEVYPVVRSSKSVAANPDRLRSRLARSKKAREAK